MSSMTQASGSALRMERFQKTKLCKFHAAGACTRGEDCNFAHSIVQVREQPDFSKTRLCPDFRNYGRCANGDKCTFAHGKSDLRGKKTKADRIQQTQQASIQAAGFQAMQMPIVYMLPMMQQPHWVVSQESNRQEHSEINADLPECTSRQITSDTALQETRGVGSQKSEECSEINAYLPDSMSRQTTADDTLDAIEEFNFGFSVSSGSDETWKNPSEDKLSELDAESKQLHSRISEDGNVGIVIKNTFLHYDDHDEEPFVQRSKSMPAALEEYEDDDI